jgi:leucyl/phenylalanyl-tRNA--protein transferase
VLPIEPPHSQWQFPEPETAEESGLVGIGADLEPGTVLGAYRAGIFPMPFDNGPNVGWWSPDPRGILPLDALRVSRSLRQSMDRYDITIDTAFEQVVDECANPDRDGAWITSAINSAYCELHRLGWAHSVETRDRLTGELVGGLYGIHIGGLFAGESMFHHSRDASKVALAGLVEHLRSQGVILLDVQWLTPHLASLGAVEVPRAEYLSLLANALAIPVRPFTSEVSP